ncbi:MAG: sugar phosphate isomerase/epimerase and 4-hydroxyphenylpyruvate domain-containing protein [Saccharopolyspora sp.]|uniref:bifunctional sugar phosphate isomerase/epimerase/4-hydroxyphenylpyruvate dioxygenase family protein n=1 Tax=Saccharopolyspora sp. TaxID=33915 RepID=UPI0025D0CED9|nr:sugar phosphate isomerase/epimerase and 4-hydroxyphenylpyruvate domain-containing protein [Saccharopolyspora sp.]MBQ6641895.1 sugar phosphate isomerase/epimerase and 4-hydroxyphenylpyruvate domain-containing protein [Saccharopolyspora sp.]
MSTPPADRDRSIATVCLSGPLEDKLTAAAAAGFDGVEIFENDLIAAACSPAQVRAQCADLGLSIDLYQPFRDFESVPRDVLRANLRRAERKFDLMAQLGADTVLVCSSTSPDAVDDDDLAAEQLRELAELAAGRGIRVCYEALAWGRFVNTYEHAWRIVRRADHPALGVCLDSFHILSRGSDLTPIRTIPAEKLFFLQLADAPRLNMDLLQWSRHHRLFPGQGEFDLAGFVRTVLAAGYAGPLSLEVFNDVFRQSDPGPAAVDAMRSLRALEESVDGPLSGSAPRPDPALPAPPALSGTAFVELGADDAGAQRLSGTLSALGFRHTGTHRSKPVRLWTQGDARVLVNTGPEHDGGQLAALGVHSDAPTDSVRRSEGLLAPVLPRTARPDEADLSSVAAPDGTALFFCRTGASEEAGWLGDFEPTGTPVTSAGITGIDHVTMTQPFDHYDEAILFYRSVLGLHPMPPVEFAAPFGLVRSRMVVDREESVRIALDSAVLRRGPWAPAVRHPQYVALRSEDVFATARAVRDAGASVVQIPDNYYDDLDARLEPRAELLAELRANSVLYDRDAAGEYLHFSVAVPGARVFFEVVQRIGGYRGRGESNAPVRMAAHRRERLERGSA